MHRMKRKTYNTNVANNLYVYAGRVKRRNLFEVAYYTKVLHPDYIGAAGLSTIGRLPFSI